MRSLRSRAAAQPAKKVVNWSRDFNTEIARAWWKGNNILYRKQLPPQDHTAPYTTDQK